MTISMSMKHELSFFILLVVASSLLRFPCRCGLPFWAVVRSTVAAPACAPITGAEARAAKEDFTGRAGPSAPRLASLRAPASVKVGPALPQAMLDEPASITEAGRTSTAWILGLTALSRRRAARRACSQTASCMRVRVRMLLLLRLLLLLACC